MNKVEVDLKINVEPNDSYLWCRMFCPKGYPQLIIKLLDDMSQRHFQQHRRNKNCNPQIHDSRWLERGDSVN